jgi:predicted MFS family arabinose efflux permease
VFANLLMAKAEPRFLFLIGIVPALLVLWIRKAVPEPEEWKQAQANATKKPGLAELFGADVRRITVWVLLVCGISLTAHWAFIFFHVQHLRNLPEVLPMSPAEKNRLASTAMYLVIGSSIIGNFVSGWISRYAGYRATITWMFLGYAAALFAAYYVPREHQALLAWFPIIGFFQGVFALFTMYLPPLFPTLLRTTGAGFCYNIGRIVAAIGTVFFGLSSHSGDHRLALFCTGFLFLPAAGISLLLPKVKD